MTNTPMPNKHQQEREELIEKLRELAKPYCLIDSPSEEQIELGGTFTVGTGEASRQLTVIANIEAISDFILARDAKREASLKADIAHAIGYCQGLGHRNSYLEKRYPELAALTNQQAKGEE